jgi:hypothetical protein
MIVVHPEDFAEWLQHPTTEAVVAMFGAWADAQQAAWLRASWEGGKADLLLLTELRTRADAYRSMAELTPERIADLNGEQS